MPSDELQAITAAAQLVKRSGIGPYLAKVFGSIPEDVLGLAVGDWLHEKRKQNLAQLQANTAERLKEIDREHFSDPSPSVLIPILQAAADESREELQKLWAGLTASSMTNNGRLVRRAYIEALKNMDPPDAKILIFAQELAQYFPIDHTHGNEMWWEKVEERLLSNDRTDPRINSSILSRRANANAGLRDTPSGHARAIAEEYSVQSTGVPKEEMHISVRNLENLGCIETGRAVPVLTKFGSGLLEACDVTITARGGENSSQIQAKGRSRRGNRTRPSSAGPARHGASKAK